MQKLKIKEPKKIERQINALINNNPESKFIFRLCSLKMLLNDSSFTTESLGKLMQASPRSVANWIHWINAEGNIEILRDKEKPGRTTKLNKKKWSTSKPKFKSTLMIANLMLIFGMEKFFHIILRSISA